MANSNTEKTHKLTKTEDLIPPLERLIKEAKDSIAVSNRLSKVAVYQAAGNSILSVLLIISVIAAFNSENKYFASSPDGKITPMVPLDSPVINDNGVKLFARDTLYDVLNLDFDTWREDLEKGRVGFIDKGLGNLIGAVKDAGIIAIMEKDRVNLRTEFSTPVISKKGVKDKVATWIVQIPITYNFVGQNTSSKALKFILIATIQAVDTKTNPKGVAISQVVTVPQK
ncbi:DotI/IcmL family type IV secretion protein [Escherichia coli]|nr:DotI/IcmL family type IV secretion protein [Escherichia coli]MDY8698477.1 DotI/IcmL family type IV secretion protein [Escherichia coli]MDY8725046.1 DotI/IcmL family type IV secretion protein [Escherichia coli]MDY8846072.1 DotI/IcmL family type IV secretion protein [Escherichia coli]